MGASMGEDYARAGFRVVAGYGSNEHAANKQVALLNGINEEAGHTAIKADITDPNGREEIFNTLRQLGGVTHLVLAASGGLEKDKRTDDPFEYARLVNRDAQVAMARGMADVWGTTEKAARRIVFLTSHQAWYLGQQMSDRSGVMQMIAPWDVISRDENDYGPVAFTKRRGVNELTQMQQEGEWGLEVATTDLIPDSKVARAAAMFYYQREEDKALPRSERPAVWMQRLVTARQEQLENLGLNTKLYSTAEFAGLTVARALDMSWTGINHLILPDHMNQDSGRRFLNRDSAAPGMAVLQ